MVSERFENIFWGIISTVVIISVFTMFYMSGKLNDSRIQTCFKRGGVPVITGGIIRACARPESLIDFNDKQ